MNLRWIEGKRGFPLPHKASESCWLLQSLHLSPVLHTRLPASEWEPKSGRDCPAVAAQREQGYEEAGTVPTGRRALFPPDFLRSEGDSIGSSHLQPAAWVVFLEGKHWQIPPGARAPIDKLEIWGGLSVLWGQAWGAQEIKSRHQALGRVASSWLW